VLLSGPYPPPVGGIGAFNQLLLASSLPTRVNLSFVLTSAQNRTLSRTGALTASNLLAGVQDCARFAIAAILHRPHVCHITTTFGLSFVKNSVCVAVARLLGSRVLLHPHCSYSVLYTKRSRLWQSYFRQVIRLTQGVVALSREWCSLSSVISGCRVYELPNALNLAQYRDAAMRHMAPEKNGSAVRVLYLGYLGCAKGSFDLIEAAADQRLKSVDVAIDLVGDELTPGELQSVKERIQALGLSESVRVHPFAVGSAKARFFQQADVFVYPSHHEGMPMAVLEAMACALPIVATSVGGLPDIVHQGINGLLVPPGRPAAIASALYDLCLDGDLRGTMGRNAYQIAWEKYDIENRVEQLVEIYHAAAV
jgi:glycosyltransferase involved in cell wall biosynthesis